MRYIRLCIIILCVASNSNAADYYISPTGNDSSNGLTDTTPFKTFNVSFSNVSAGDTLYVMDGEYSVALGTGVINFDTANSGQPVSGISKAVPTIIKAVNNGSVTMDGTGEFEGRSLFIGRTAEKQSYVKIEGIRFNGGGRLFNTSYVYVKNCAFNGNFSVGTVDHINGNTYNLIEDVWIWASGQRILATNYAASNTVWRRVVIRGDGCSEAACLGSGNPNVGFTVYNSQNVSVQNMLVIDRVLGGGYPYGDFATAQHSGGVEISLGNNEWLGCISLNSEDSNFHFEGDSTISPTFHMVNSVAAGNATTTNGFNLDRGTDSIIENLTSYYSGSTTGALFRYGDSETGQTSRSLIGVGDASYGVVRGGVASYIDLYGTFSSGRYYETTVSPGDSSADPELLYLLRIEDGSIFDGAGYAGSNYGATILNKYGSDGLFQDDSGYNTLTSSSLWPYPNEDEIKVAMAADSERGFCATDKQLDGVSDITLTSYIWEYLSNQIPSDIYGDTIYTGSMFIGTGSTFTGTGTIGVN